MFDWPSIATHAVEMLIASVGTWFLTELRLCRRACERQKGDIDAAFGKIRIIQDEISEIKEKL